MKVGKGKIKPTTCLLCTVSTQTSKAVKDVAVVQGSLLSAQ